MAAPTSEVPVMTVLEMIESTFPDFQNNKVNKVNFKLLQIVLHLLANKLDILDQDVEIRLAEKQHQEKVDDSDLLPKDEATDNEKDGDSELLQKDKKTEESSLTEKALSRQPSIQIASASAFRILQDMVNDLLDRTKPVPLPSVPSHQKLRAEVSLGNTTLLGTMSAMQLTSRVQATEQGIIRMGGLLIGVANAGVLPHELNVMIANLKEELQQLCNLMGIDFSKVIATPEALKKSKVHPKAQLDKAGEQRPLEPGQEAERASAMAILAAAVSSTLTTGPVYVTQTEMENALDICVQESSKYVTKIAARPCQIIERICEMVERLAKEINIAEKLKTRMDQLFQIADSGHEKINDFKEVLEIRLEEVKGLVDGISRHIMDSIVKLLSVETSSENDALKILGDNYVTLLAMLENAEQAHGVMVNATTRQDKLCEELNDIADLLLEDKANREEAFMSIDDKVNVAWVRGLLTDAEFASGCDEIENKLDLCYQFFYRQEKECLSGLEAVVALKNSKGASYRFSALESFVIHNVHSQAKFLKQLERAFGAFDMAVLSRKVSRNGYCGPCMVPAQISPYCEGYGVPPRLPPLRPERQEVVTPPAVTIPPPDLRSHVSLRWVGGSHTRLVRRQPAVVLPPLSHTKQYLGFDDEGRICRMEEEALPCAQCLTTSPRVDGGGDTGLE